MRDEKRLFGNFYKVVEPKNAYTGVERKGLSSIFIYDGVIHGSNGYVYVHIPVENWVSKEDGREYLEGRAIHYVVLKEMAKKKWKRIIFTEKTIQLHASDGVYDEHHYSAIRKNGVWYVTNDSGEIPAENPEEILVPKYSVVVPDKFEHRVNYIRINPTYLESIHECFAVSKYTDGVQMEFSEPSQDGNPKPIKVTPTYFEYNLEPEWGILMPMS